MAVTEDDDQGVGGLSYADDSVEVTGGEGVMVFLTLLYIIYVWLFIYLIY